MSDFFTQSFGSEPIPTPATDGRQDRIQALAKAIGTPLCSALTVSYSDLAGHAMTALGLVQPLVEAGEEVVLEPALIEGWTPMERQDPAVVAFLQSALAHQADSLVFCRGVQAPEIQALLEGLGIPPAFLESSGGLRGHLEKRYIQTIQIRAAAPLAHNLPVHLVKEARATLREALAPPDLHSWGSAGWLHYVGDLRHFGPMAYKVGLAEGEPSEAALDLLKYVLLELSPDQFLSVCRGLGSLPKHPAALAVAFQKIVPELLAGMVDQMVVRGLHWLVLHHPLEDLIAAYPGSLISLVEPLRVGLAKVESESAPLAQKFLEDLAWQAQNLNQQLDQTQTAEEFLALPVESRIQLLERTLKAHRLDALVELIGHLGEVSAKGEGPAKFATIRTLRAFVTMAAQRTVPDYIVDYLETLLLGIFGTEMDQDCSKVMREAILDAFRIRLLRSQPDKLVRVLQQLEGTEETCMEQHLLSVPLSWARQTLESEQFLDLSLECLFQGERFDSLNTCMVYFSYLGDSLYRRIIWRLGRESDRSRRDRMVRVLITAGGQVEDALLQMLRPTMPWYHARNILFVLAYVGTPKALVRLPSFLDHEDSRVRIVALRALRKCSTGKTPLGHLIARLEDPDESIRQEASQILATLRTKEALTALTSLATDRKVPHPSRKAAIEGLGHTQLAEAAEVLVSIAQNRGSLLKRGESDDLRIAAARSLTQIPGGKEHLLKIIQDEGKAPLAQHLALLLR